MVLDSILQPNQWLIDAPRAVPVHTKKKLEPFSNVKVKFCDDDDVEIYGGTSVQRNTRDLVPIPDCQVICDRLFTLQPGQRLPEDWLTRTGMWEYLKGSGFSIQPVVNAAEHKLVGDVETTISDGMLDVLLQGLCRKAGYVAIPTVLLNLAQANPKEFGPVFVQEVKRALDQPGIKAVLVPVGDATHF